MLANTSQCFHARKEKGIQSGIVWVLILLLHNQRRPSHALTSRKMALTPPPLTAMLNIICLDPTEQGGSGSHSVPPLSLCACARLPSFYKIIKVKVRVCMSEGRGLASCFCCFIHLQLHHCTHTHTHLSTGPHSVSGRKVSSALVLSR